MHIYEPLAECGRNCCLSNVLAFPLQQNMDSACVTVGVRLHCEDNAVPTIMVMLGQQELTLKAEPTDVQLQTIHA